MSCQEKPTQDPRTFVSQTSQMRLPGETFSDAQKRYRDSLSPLNLDAYLNLHSVKNMATSLEDLDLSSVPEWTSEQLEEGFVLVRDKRFLEDPSRAGLRRSSWLYPDDGCFARSDLMVRNLSLEQLPNLKKIFVFGPLEQPTPNHPQGVVYWWYHTAPIMKVDGNIYIFDPATGPSGPQLFTEWVEQMAQPFATLEFALCSPSAYGPMSQCLLGAPLSDQRAQTDQLLLLDLEWSRLESLSRDPAAELGDSPPWL